jgi:hypothetical protein
MRQIPPNEASPIPVFIEPDREFPTPSILHGTKCYIVEIEVHDGKFVFAPKQAVTGSPIANAIHRMGRNHKRVSRLYWKHRLGDRRRHSGRDIGPASYK